MLTNRCQMNYPLEQARHILGAQGNIWTEFIASEDHVEYMAFPRGTALVGSGLVCS